MSYYEVYQLEPKVVHMPYYAPGVRNEYQAREYMSSLCEIGWALNKRVVFGVVKVTETFELDQLVQYREIASTGWYGPAPPDTLHPAVLQELRDAFLVDSRNTDSSDKVSDVLLEAILNCIPEYTPSELARAIQELKENTHDVLGIDEIWYAKGDMDELVDALGKSVITTV